MKKDSIYVQPQPLRKTLSVDKTSQSTIMKNQSMDLNSNKLNGMFLTTKDAQTLTHGPTIFMANEVNKIAQFYVKTAQIPQYLYDNLLGNILKNNQIYDKIDSNISLLTSCASSESNGILILANTSANP